MRVAGEAVPRQAGIENGDLAAGTAELQGGGEAGKAAADDDDVIHGDGLRVVDGGRWAPLFGNSWPKAAQAGGVDTTSGIKKTRVVLNTAHCFVDVAQVICRGTSA